MIENLEGLILDNSNDTFVGPSGKSTEPALHSSEPVFETTVGSDIPAVEESLRTTSVDANEKQPVSRPASPTPAAARASSPAPASSPRHGSLVTALRAHGEKMTWSVDWEKVDLALNGTQHAKCSTSVICPEIVSSMMMKHVVYTVKTEPMGYSVRRRYKDFVWLRDMLVARYTGLFIPALPISTTFSTKASLSGGKVDTEGDFVKNRMAQLHMFTTQICKIPFLRSDPNLHAFISMQSEKDFKAIVDHGVEKLPAYEHWRNEGLEAWLSLLDSFSTDRVDTTRTVGDFYRQLDVLRATLDQMDRECRVTGRKAVVLAKAMNGLGEQTLSWHKLELDLLDPLKNEYLNPHGDRIRVLMNQLVAGQNFWGNASTMIPKIIARVYLSNIQYQFVQVEGFRALLQAREALVRDLERAEKEKLKAFDEKEKFRTAPPDTKTRRLSLGIFGQKNLNEYEEMCTKKTEAVNAIYQQLDRMTRALVYCEIDRFYQGRVESITQLLGSLAAINLEMAANANMKWTEVVSAAGIDTNNFSDLITLLQQSLDDDEVFQEV